MDAFMFEGRGVYIAVAAIIIIALAILGSKIVKLISGILAIVVFGGFLIFMKMGTVDIDASAFIKQKGLEAVEQVADKSDNIRVDSKKGTVEVKLKKKWYDVQDIVKIEKGKNAMLVKVADEGSIKIKYNDENIVKLLEMLEG